MSGQLAALGAFPGAGDKFVLLALKPDGQLEVRSNLPDASDPRAVIRFLRGALEDIERETLGVHLLRAGPTPIPGGG